MPPSREILIGSLSLIERDDLVDSRIDLVDIDETDKLFEHRTATGRNADEAPCSADERARLDRDTTAAADPADHDNRPTGSCGLQGARQRALAAGLDYDIDPGGITLGAMYGFGNVAGSLGTDSSTNFIASYAGGLLSASIAYASFHNASAGANSTEYAGGAAYMIGKARIFGYVTDVQLTSGAKQRATTFDG